MWLAGTFALFKIADGSEERVAFLVRPLQYYVSDLKKNCEFYTLHPVHDIRFFPFDEDFSARTKREQTNIGIILQAIVERATRFLRYVGA